MVQVVLYQILVLVLMEEFQLFQQYLLLVVVLAEILEEVFQLLVELEKMVDLEVLEHLNPILQHQSLEVVEIHLPLVPLKDKMEEVVLVILVAVEVALVLPAKLLLDQVKEEMVE